MDKATDLITNALATMVYTPISEEGDYTKDDLLICGKCHTPRQMRLEILGAMTRVPVTCDCEAARLDAQEAAQRARRLEERKEARRQLAFEDTSWTRARFDHDDRRDTKASGICYRYAESFQAMQDANMGLMLYGGIGCGKTFLAACIANAVIDQGKRVIMTSLPSLIGSLGLGEERDEAIRELTSVHLLILDDVGVERSTEYSLEQTYEVINARYKAGRPLIVTTNLTMGEIKREASLGRKRSFDRLIEMCTPVLVSGESRRPDIARKKFAAAMRLLEDT